MSNYQNYVEQSAAHVLANHEILMASPSASRLTSFYPTPSESQNTIAQAVCNSGQLTIQANSKLLGQTCDFIVSSPNLMDTPHLQMEITIPQYTGFKPDGADVDPAIYGQAKNLYAGSYHAGWGFDSIDQIEITFANSNISNLQIKGHAMRDWSLLQCKNEKERMRMLNIAGRHQVYSRDADRKFSAVVPLSFLFWRAAGGVKGGFPIDGRALNGPVIFRIRFNPLKYFIGPHASDFDAKHVPDADYPCNIDPAVRGERQHGGVVPVAAGNAFSQLNLTFRTYQLMDGAFSVSKALEANPGFVYSLPSLWMNTYSQQVQIKGSSGEGALNLNSAPAGMIQAMILRIRPINETGTARINDGLVLGSQEDGPNSKLNFNPYAAANTVETVAGNSEKLYRPYRPWSLPLKMLKLSYSGQAIFWARTREEIDEFYSNVFNDDLKTDVCGAPDHLSVTINYLLQKNVAQLAALLDEAGDTVENPSSKTYIPNLSVSTYEDANRPHQASVKHDTQSLIIPLMHDGNSIFRHRDFENLPHYSGSTLQLEFEIDTSGYYRSNGFDRIHNNPDGSLPTRDVTAAFPPSNGDAANLLATPQEPGVINFAANADPKVDEHADGCFMYPSNRTQKASGTAGDPDSSQVTLNNNPNADGARAYTAAGGLVEVDVTYVVASLFQITNGVAELQL